MVIVGPETHIGCLCMYCCPLYIYAKKSQKEGDIGLMTTYIWWRCVMMMREVHHGPEIWDWYWYHNLFQYLGCLVCERHHIYDALTSIRQYRHYSIPQNSSKWGTEREVHLCFSWSSILRKKDFLNPKNSDSWWKKGVYIIVIFEIVSYKVGSVLRRDPQTKRETIYHPSFNISSRLMTNAADRSSTAGVSRRNGWKWVTIIAMSIGLAIIIPAALLHSKVYVDDGWQANLRSSSSHDDIA